ncbi:hypothetical protein Hanom_Chr08g00717231 [Helianthus anomalus]
MPIVMMVKPPVVVVHWTFSKPNTLQNTPRTTPMGVCFDFLVFGVEYTTPDGAFFDHSPLSKLYLSNNNFYGFLFI